MKSRTALFCLALLGAVMFSGCMGGGSSKTTSTSSTSSSSPDGVSVNASISASNSSSSSSSSTSTSVTPRPAKTWDVTINNHAFTPAQLTIQKGDTVRWTQQDTQQHTATSDANATESFDSGTLTTIVSQPYSFTFNKVGSDPYHCNIHSDMHGTITVVDAMSN